MHQNRKHVRTLLRTITRDKHKNSSYNVNNRADDNDYDINDRNDRRDGDDNRVVIFYVHYIELIGVPIKGYWYMSISCVADSRPTNAKNLR